MENTSGTTTNNAAKTFKASEIKSIVQGNGKTTVGDRDCVLKHPASSDPKLQEIVNNPALTVKSVGSPSAQGECEYELSAEGKTVNIKFDTKKCCN